MVVNKKHKKPFLLLELLIAITLFLFCTPLFIKDPLLLLQKEIASLEKMELQRIAENSFAVIKADLYKQEISYHLLCASKKEALFLEKDTPIKIAYSPFLSKSYKEKYKLWTIKEKKEEEAGKILRRIGVEIVFTPIGKGGLKQEQKFLYEVFVLKTKKIEAKHA